MAAKVGDSECQNGKKMAAAKTWADMLRAWPFHSLLIVLLEFTIMTTNWNNILNLYYINVLHYSLETTVILVNINGIVLGSARLAGSIVSDCYLGKFKSILFGSAIFIVGKILLTTATLLPLGFPHPFFDFLAVLIIFVGNSAVVPSMAPFGGDQFEEHQEKMISLFCSILYAAINMGAIFSSLVMPMLRARPCFGKDSCYSLSFTVSTVGMIVGTSIFLLSSKLYTKKPPSRSNIFVTVYHVIKTARANRANALKNNNDSKALKFVDNSRHWLDFYLDTHKCEQDPKCMELLRGKEESDKSTAEEHHHPICQKAQFVDDLRCLMRVLVVLIPMPVFWALYNQQYTVWMNQALMLDGRLWGNFLLLPDQMQVLNPLIVIGLIFLFQSGIYPCLERIVVLTPLRKMVAGGLIASLAFLISGFVQLMANPTLPDNPPTGFAFVSVVNTLDNCTLHVAQGSHSVLLSPNSALINDKPANRSELFLVQSGKSAWQIQGQGSDCPPSMSGPANFTFELNQPMHVIVVGPNGTFLASAETSKPTGGSGQFKVGLLLALDDTERQHQLKWQTNDSANANSSLFNSSFMLAFCRAGAECNHHEGENFFAFLNKTGQNVIKNIPILGAGSEGEEALLYPYIEVRPGRWRLHRLLNEPRLGMPKENLAAEPLGNDGILDFQMMEMGGIYTMVLTGSSQRPKLNVLQVVPPNSVSILWQMPQIFTISVAEVLVAITGIEFAYSQSGSSMKTIASACWAFCMSLGNLLIILLTLLPIGNLATKAFLCAGAMLVDVLLLAIIANYFYQYRHGTLMAVNDQKHNNEKESESEGESSCSSTMDNVEMEGSKSPPNCFLSTTNPMPSKIGKPENQPFEHS